MTDRPTGLTVTLPLVWRGYHLFAAKMVTTGSIMDGGHDDWLALADGLFEFFPTRAEAEAAVEAAVVRALGYQ